MTEAVNSEGSGSFDLAASAPSNAGSTSMLGMKAISGFEHASAEIRAGRARPSHLWVLLSEESDRDGYAIKPSPWEGPGEYQNVSFGDDRLGVFVRLPLGRHLPEAA